MFKQPVERFYIDKIAFKDLIEFYDFDYELIRGYYFEEGFNTKIRTFIKKLFDLRLKHKKEKNPLQSTIKLLLNSIYGKSILKAIEAETKCIPKDKMFGYIWKNYNYIKEVVDEPSIESVYVKKVKTINNHFNLPQFGASVLSWSKHIMNQVMATAEQNGINIYYQDTDSMHLLEDDIKKIGDIFFKKYNRTLIGGKMCQFHNDFDSFEGSVGQIHSRKLIALGKKSYSFIPSSFGIPENVQRLNVSQMTRVGIWFDEIRDDPYEVQWWPLTSAAGNSLTTPPLDFNEIWVIGV